MYHQYLPNQLNPSFYFFLFMQALIKYLSH